MYILIMTKPSYLDIEQAWNVNINEYAYTGYWSLCFYTTCDALRFKPIKLFKDGDLNGVSTTTCTFECVGPTSESNVTHWVIRFYCKPYATITSIVSILKNICIAINHTDSHRFLVYDDPVNHTSRWRTWNPISSTTIRNFNKCYCHIVHSKDRTNQIIPNKT